MIFTRDFKAKHYDPYWDWDYVTCTLSRDEMLRLATWIDNNKRSTGGAFINDDF